MYDSVRVGVASVLYKYICIYSLVLNILTHWCFGVYISIYRFCDLYEAYSLYFIILCSID
jgi:hypothetical protein